MANSTFDPRIILRVAQRWVRPNWASFTNARQPRLWVLSIAAGVCGGLVAIGFRFAIGVVQALWMGTASEDHVAALAVLPWWIVVAGPVAGGVVVGAIIYFWPTSGRPGGVADVIEARTLDTSKLTLRGAVIGTSISAVTLGFGGSAGREGPVVYLAAAVSRSLFRLFALPPSSRRVMLGCGVAAAIAASFNAPIAGVLFAHEVILGHFALSALAPIVIAAVVAAVMSRFWFGDAPAFVVPDFQISSYWEIPAFALLGVTCALVAILFQTALIGADWASRYVRIRDWLRPVAGGLLVGAIALAFPQVLGVGYQATDAALAGSLGLGTMLALIVAKTVATAITLGSRFGGGIFSPALFVGAMTGGAFGLIAASVFPDMASSQGLYAIIGMGAVTAAVLGAPISTAVMIFELTGGFAFSIALLFSVSIATGLSQAVMGRSYFYWQLYTRGIMLDEGPHRHVVKFIRVSDFLTPLAADETPPPFELASGAAWLRPGDTLQSALRAFDASAQSRLPVFQGTGKSRIQIGWADQVQALTSFNRALVEKSREEHL